jgi:hypothetical protein
MQPFRFVRKTIFQFAFAIKYLLFSHHKVTLCIIICMQSRKHCFSLVCTTIKWVTPKLLWSLRISNCFRLDYYACMCKKIKIKSLSFVSCKDSFLFELFRFIDFPSRIQLHLVLDFKELQSNGVSSTRYFWQLRFFRCIHDSFYFKEQHFNQVLANGAKVSLNGK